MLHVGIYLLMENVIVMESGNLCYITQNDCFKSMDNSVIGKPAEGYHKQMNYLKCY